jgi:hypothetical protein
VKGFEKDQNGRIFMDRSSKYFEMLVNALRTGDDIEVPEEKAEIKMMKREFKYFGFLEYFKLEKVGKKNKI